MVLHQVLRVFCSLALLQNNTIQLTFSLLLSSPTPPTPHTQQHHNQRPSPYNPHPTTIMSSTTMSSTPANKPLFQPQGSHQIPLSIFKKFEAVDNYLVDSLIPQDASLKGALERNEKEGLPSIDVSPNDGKFLYLLAKMNNVKRVLEVGTLGGYSGIVSTFFKILIFFFLKWSGRSG